MNRMLTMFIPAAKTASLLAAAHVSEGKAP
jgi:hypothetical protein